MTNHERLVQFEGSDLFAREEERPVEGKSFDNLRRFIAYGVVAPVRTYPPGVKPDYSDTRIYYPSAKHTNLENWERNLRISYDYVLGEETHEEIGRRNGNLSREAIRIIIKKTVMGLHEGTDEESRDRFPFESFDFAKPLTLASRQRSSEAKGGISFEIAGKIEQGATLKELKKDYITGRLTKARPILKSWGYQLEKEINPILPQFEGLKNLDATDEEIQSLLDKIRNHRQYQVFKQAGLVIDLSTVAKKAGLYVGSDQVYFISESLARKKLPQAKVAKKRKDKNGQERISHYHIIAGIDQPNAIDILRADRSLDDLRINPVRQIAGPRAEKLPNTTQLKSEEYQSVSKLIGEIRGLRSTGKAKAGIKMADIIEGSPVGIYGTGNKISYRKDQREELRNHLESRLRTLGMLNL
jgi:hypothetical protein